MTNQNLIITTVAILVAAGLIAFAVRSGNNAPPANKSAPNSELTVPYGSDDNSNQNNPIPREVERGTVLDPNMKQLPKPTELTIDTSKDYKAVIVTSRGTIKIDLLEKSTPNTVNNFVYLANNQFYNDVIFHRVIKGFMIQGGDPTGTGSSGPGYTIEDEAFEGEYTRGTVAMARTMAPNSAGSQFFIMHQDTPIAKDYVIFGQVEEGMEVVDAIAESETNAADKPLEDSIIKSVEIIAQ